MGCGHSPWAAVRLAALPATNPGAWMLACAGAAYLNGGWPIFLGQFFSLMAGLLSVGTIIDCSFATIDETTIDLGEDLQIEAGGVGFLFVQKSDGHCYWYNYAADEHPEDKLQAYWSILGTPWEVAAILTWACASLSSFFFLYSISFCCSSQIKQVRYLIGFIMAGIMFICQACTFIVYAENFCQKHNCSFSRGSGISLASMVCYLIAGLGFFNSKDYPGESILDKLEEQNKKTYDDEESQPESMDDPYEYQDDDYKQHRRTRRPSTRQDEESYRDELEPLPEETSAQSTAY
eukprot:CAMPEP_0116153114 /NCGR_PEP_ID=MMETSP0329-20121206/21048_1 /TAXON_ID=697910 /ORGANISM="Pseudo-nitzschia arenysensis, Strain B593" /LENGTH=291 /DNA_ID=CAMNT_0003649953 /DNA_START=188 /DNA_END=1065 /DNA_ORIENTATION=+